MSIPISIDPMGTLGSELLAGYVLDGLILAFDALLETPGTRNYLTNQVSGTRCDFEYPLLIADGVIKNASGNFNQFNKLPNMTDIDGHSPVGLDYSADICAESGYISALVWKAEQVLVSTHVLGFQYHDSAQGIRVQGVNGETSTPIITYPSASTQSTSAHVEHNGTSVLTVNGASVGSVNDDTAGVDGCSMALARQAKLFAYRLYNRRLTVAEQKQNYEMDKKRYNLP